jgi:hypothetical protein
LKESSSGIRLKPSELIATAELKLNATPPAATAKMVLRGENVILLVESTTTKFVKKAVIVQNVTPKLPVLALSQLNETFPVEVPVTVLLVIFAYSPELTELTKEPVE